MATFCGQSRHCQKTLVLQNVFGDGVFVIYLENRSVGGCWRSGMRDIPIPKEKTEQGARSLGQPRISLAGNQLLGSWGNPCSLATFLSFSPCRFGDERG